jgi:hypothetical protein
MGAHDYQYVVDYEADIQAALDKLREKVFARGEFNGAEKHPRTPMEALKMAGTDGTRSILDITTISDEPDFCTASPLSPHDLKRYFGTERPTLRMVEESSDFWEGLERGMARYIIVYDGEKPGSIFFAGYSFD